jgi:NADH dehydrogenase (ubiquinone) 1 beta subcomplex subunit 9
MSTPAQVAHRLQIQSLYKRSLKLSLDWYIQRDLWRQKALAIRQEFEQNKHVSNPRDIQQLVQNAEKELESWDHPDPYKCMLFFNCGKMCVLIANLL